MKTLVAVTQMTAGSEKAQNLALAESLIEQAASRGARVVSLPENFAFMSGAEQDVRQIAEPLDGPTISRFQNLAQKWQIWVLLGGFPEKIADNSKVYNSHIVLSAQGERVCVYRKMHLFSVRLPDGTAYRESDSVMAGHEAHCFETPFFKGGLSICYDLRFAHLFWELRHLGAQVLFVPAAFTETTGKAHWEVLLRARAIETQSYVVAAAQYGRHSDTRKTYGHAMIVDPWGQIIASCGDNANVAVGEIDLSYVQTIRQNMPILEHCHEKGGGPTER